MVKPSLRSILYHHFLLGNMQGITDLTDLLEFLLEDSKYPIGFGSPNYLVSRKLMEECFYASENSKYSEENRMMQLWQITRFIGSFLPEKEQEELREYLQSLPINIET